MNIIFKNHIFLSLSLIVAIFIFFQIILFLFIASQLQIFLLVGCKLTQVKLATQVLKVKPKATTPILESSHNLLMVLLIIHWMDSFESYGWCQHFKFRAQDQSSWPLEVRVT
jgi:hypothetical protein